MKIQPLWESLTSFKKDQNSEIRTHLRRVFDHVSPKGIAQIQSYCHIRHYNQEEHIFRINEPGVSMYVILRGKVRIYRQEPDGEEHILVEHTSGDSFGEIALVEDLPRTASARAVEECDLLAFSRSDLELINIRKQELSSELYHNISRFLAQRLVRTNEYLDELASERDRLRNRERESTSSHKSEGSSIAVESLQVKLKRVPGPRGE